MIIKMLQDQLEAANAANLQLNLTVSGLNATISELRAATRGMEATIANLEALLQERDNSLAKAQNRMRGLSKLVENKSERQKPEVPAPGNEEEKKAEELRKARGNNGARRNMHFEMETVERDVYPEGMEGMNPFSTRDVIRYRMIPPSFIKEVLHVHTVKVDGTLISAKAPLTPLLNSSYDGSFIAGIAQLRYLYSMPVERIVAYFRENGFDLDKPTAHGLLAKTAGLFDKLYGAMRRRPSRRTATSNATRPITKYSSRRRTMTARAAARAIFGLSSPYTLASPTSSMTMAHVARTSF